MRVRQNDCVCCPQGCIHCNNGIPYTVITCDECDEEIEEYEVYELDGKDYCKKCYTIETMTLDDAYCVIADMRVDAERDEDYELMAALFIAENLIGEKIGDKR